MPVWNNIFSNFSGAHNLPGTQPFMQLDEFDRFVTNSGLLNDSFAQRDIPLIYNLSMLT